MLFLLKSINGKYLYLRENRTYTVGRKECDLLIEGDGSVSRKHAELRVTDNEVQLVDLNSKYKTSLNNQEIPPNKTISLKNEDEILFGCLKSTYKFQTLHLCTTSTKLNSSEKNKLLSNLIYLRGEYCENLTPNCTTLTVKSVSLTLKLLLALIDEKCFVLPSYWTKFVENVSKNLPPPNVEDFNNIPMGEQVLKSNWVAADRRRRTLFKEKFFIFASENIFSKFKEIIMKAGGSCIYWKQSPIPLNKLKKMTQEVIVVQNESSENHPKDLQEYIDYNRAQGIRAISFSEIPLAIINTCCSKTCNPKFNLSKEVFKMSCSMKSESGAILAAETETQTKFTSFPAEKSIQPSFDVIEMSQPLQIKEEPRNITTVPKRSLEAIEENPFKKMRFESSLRQKRETKRELVQASTSKDNSIQEVVNDSRKRKALDESTSNPFAKFAKKTNRKPTISKDNPFAINKPLTSQVKIETEEVITLNDSITEQRETSVEDKKESICHLIDFTGKTSSLADIVWLPKHSVLDNTSIKNTTDDLDPEEQSYIDSFRDKLTIKVVPLIVKEETKQNISCNVSANGLRNFKKFKKVRPVKCHSKINKTELSLVRVL